MSWNYVHETKKYPKYSQFLFSVKEKLFISFASRFVSLYWIFIHCSKIYCFSSIPRKKRKNRNYLKGLVDQKLFAIYSETFISTGEKYLINICIKGWEMFYRYLYRTVNNAFAPLNNSSALGLIVDTFFALLPLIWSEVFLSIN